MRRSQTSFHDIARRVFHYDSLRPGQEQAISALLSGRDTLAVMPTGHGKSAIYQIAALLLDGPTIVVSPLIALQKDQSEFLNRRSAGGAATVNSHMPPSSQEEALDAASEGETEFLFLSPEQLANPERLQEVAAAKPSLFVIDEAHCISQWGHSFRPDYLGLGAAVKALKHPVVLALTATANPEVRAEIVSRLGMRDPEILVHGFDRPNIWLGVETASGEEKKRALLLDRVKRSTLPGLVYVSTRRHAEEIVTELASAGVPSAAYHAGMNKRDRQSVQERFMQDALSIVVATSAFGMGIDKPNVRFVYHFDSPGSLDSYYQEMGRAGRDGSPASAVLFFCPKDLTLHKFFSASERIGEKQFSAAVAALTAASEKTVTQAALAERSAIPKTKLKRVLQALADLHAIRIAKSGAVTLLSDAAALEEQARQAVELQTRIIANGTARIEEMRVYAENLDCRRARLLRYFGEDAPESCGNCDNCQGRGTTRAELIAQTRAQTEEAIAESPAS